MGTLLKAAIAKDFLVEGGDLAKSLAAIGADAYTRVGIARAQAGMNDSASGYYYNYPEMQGGQKRRRSLRPQPKSSGRSSVVRRRLSRERVTGNRRR